METYETEKHLYGKITHYILNTGDISLALFFLFKVFRAMKVYGIVSVDF